MKIEFFKHNIGKKEIARVNKALRSLFLTTGPETGRFEEKLSDYLGVRNSVGVYSCTSGLFLSLKALEIGEGDEVITTPFTFVATSNSALYCGAKIVFVDVEAESGNMDLSLLEHRITDRTKVIMPVHLYGNMCNIKTIKEIAGKAGLNIVEDSAHCIEGEFDGIKPGQLSDAACFSFYATKNITSGEGGAIAVNDDELADRLKVLRLHGMDKSALTRYTEQFAVYDVPVLGYKFNMFDIQAALLIPQLERIEKVWLKKRQIFEEYKKYLDNIEEIQFHSPAKNIKPAYHLLTIRVDPAIRDGLMDYLYRKGIGVALHYKPVHLMKYYRDTFGYKDGDFPVAEYLSRSSLTLPFYSKLKKKQIHYIIKTLKQGLFELKAGSLKS
ncbi:MAG: DegT/DnrJ/EryC1/StrS family aminotransferase [Spirochaetes bacterium]|nr:DegT/DnrJ/EryC1/StrS family aminotransferase [Spirochaetota bacterium]